MRIDPASENRPRECLPVSHAPPRRASSRPHLPSFALGLLALCSPEFAPLTADTAAAVPATADPPIPPAELAALWEAQRTEIATAEIRFQCFNAALENPQNTPARVAALLDVHDLVAQPVRLEPFLLELTGRPFQVPRPWENMTIIQSGRRRRFEDAWATFVTNGDTEAVLTPNNRQLDLIPVGKSAVHYYDLADIRWTPSPRVSPNVWTFLHRAENDAVFNVPPSPGRTQFQTQATVDLATGIVTHTITRRPDGDPVAEMYQRGLDVHASGIVCPRLRLDLQYAAGVVRTARVILVQSARFNEPVDDAAFRLPVNRGLKIIDYRGTEKTAFVATEPAPDALALPVFVTNSPAVPSVRRPASPATQRPWTLLIVAHVAALFATALLLRRRRRASPTRQR